MLDNRHRNETDTDGRMDDGVSAAAEARIREDERRRVLAGAGAPAPDEWRTIPPSADAPHVDDPRDAQLISDRAHADPTYAVDEEVVTRRAAFSFGQLLILGAGAAALAFGIVAVIRAGVDNSLSQPTVGVFGWQHTALLGLIEIGAGALLVLSGLRPGGRWLAGLVGVASIVGGALILGRVDWTVNELGAERVFGWVPIVIGAVAVVGAALPRRTRVRTERRVTTAH